MSDLESVLASFIVFILLLAGLAYFILNDYIEKLVVMNNDLGTQLEMVITETDDIRNDFRNYIESVQS